MRGVFPSSYIKLSSPMEYREGKGKYLLPKKKGQFFNPKGALSREIGILITKAEAHLRGEPISLLETMSGIGIRTVRYALEGSISLQWANEGSHESMELLKENLKLNGIYDKVFTSVEEAKHLLSKFSLIDERFDMIDLDAFGSPSEFSHYAISALKLGGILYITSTDGFTLCGLKQGAALRNYGVHTLSAKFCHELGGRVVMSQFMKVAGNFGFHMEPLVFVYDGYSWRIAMRLVKGVEGRFNDFGYVLYNPSTGEYRLNYDNQIPDLNGKWRISGPVYLGPIHNRDFVRIMYNYSKDYPLAEKVLKKILEEIDYPLYYDYTQICDIIGVSTPSRKKIVKELRKRGYQASETHISPVGIKTSAPIDILKEVLKDLNQ